MSVYAIPQKTKSFAPGLTLSEAELNKLDLKELDKLIGGSKFKNKQDLQDLIVSVYNKKLAELTYVNLQS